MVSSHRRVFVLRIQKHPVGANARLIGPFPLCLPCSTVVVGIWIIWDRPQCRIMAIFRETQREGVIDLWTKQDHHKHKRCNEDHTEPLECEVRTFEQHRESTKRSTLNSIHRCMYVISKFDLRVFTWMHITLLTTRGRRTPMSKIIYSQPRVIKYVLSRNGTGESYTYN